MGTGTVLLMSAAVFGIPIALFVFLGIHFYRAYREVRLIGCPETRLPEALKIDIPSATVTGLAGDGDFQVESCAQGPEQSNRGHGGIATIRSGRNDCRVRSNLANSFRGTRCALCGVRLGKVGCGVNKPVLMSPDRKIRIEANELAPEELPQVLRTYSRICWNCHMRGSLASLEPDLPAEPPGEFAGRPISP